SKIAFKALVYRIFLLEAPEISQTAEAPADNPHHHTSDRPASRAHLHSSSEADEWNLPILTARDAALSSRGGVEATTSHIDFRCPPVKSNSIVDKSEEANLLALDFDRFRMIKLQ
ncbi:hypothetical protein PanWU01x14_290200, partial [Parasponia andersonii]